MGKFRMRTAVLTCALLGLAALATVQATVYHEEFKSIDHWVQSKHRDDYGKVELSAGKVYADAEKSKGLRLTEDLHFYSVSSAFPTPITNDGKDLVVSFSLRNDQELHCGGGYIKLLPEMDPSAFHGETKYWLMFGPDRCGATNKVHIIFHYNGKNLEWKRHVTPPADKHTHVYTLHISPDNSYEFYLDGESKVKGDIESDWNMLEPKEIPDPDEKKPDDWVDEPRMTDPDDKKPDDWDDEPETIPDADAKKPDDWDDEEDGEWETPSIPNPKWKGVWTPRTIENPGYKGPWEARLIPNPAYKPDKELYKTPEPLTHVGIDVWRVESGGIFKDIIIGDDVAEVLDLVKQTYGSMKTAELDALAAAEAEEKKKAEEEEKKAEEEEKETEEEEITDNGAEEKEDL